MSPSLVFGVVLGAILWAYFIHRVNREIEKLQMLAKNEKESIYSVNLQAPDWHFLRKMSLQRFWVVLALILAPVLVIAWVLTLILGVLFILIPMLIWEMIEDVWLTIKRSSSHA